MSTPLETLDALRSWCDAVGSDAPTGLVALRNDIRALLRAPKTRRVIRNAYLRELAVYYYSNTSALALALHTYRTCAWPKVAHLSSPPVDASPERALCWKVCALELPVPKTVQGMAKALADGAVTKSLELVNADHSNLTPMTSKEVA